MRLGLLIPDLTKKHGWGTYSLNLIESLESAGVELRLIAPTNNTIEHENLLGNILPSIAPSTSFSLLKMALLLPKLRDLVKDCDVIHTTVEAYAPLAKAVAGKRPSFITAHGTYINLPRLRSWPVSSLYRYAFQKSQIICVSHYTAKVAQEVVPNAQTIVIPNAVDFAHYSALQRQESEKPTILSSGGVKARKGTLQLVRAVAKVREIIPDIQAIIIGTLKAEANYVAKVEAEIARLNLQDSVHLLGFVDEAELLSWYSKANVFVLPSINSGLKFEGFGLVHLEASAAGLPVIGTSDCGAEDAIVDKVTGLLVKQSEVEAELPKAILDLLQNPQKAQEMGAAGREWARRQTWEKVGQAVLAAYQAALK